MPAQVNSGKIRYQIGFVPNPNYRGGNSDVFSDELLVEIRRQNVPESRVVYFDGRHALTEEINVDYGVRSLSFQLRVAGSDTVTYCKEFPYFNFCIKYPKLMPPGGPPPHLAPTNETATIAGFHCRKGAYQGSRHLFVWYTEEIAVDDPTGAVVQLEGVPGLIMQTEEIASAGTIDAVRRETVVELNLDTPVAPETFSVPDNYRQFANIDAARAEDRRIRDEESAKEVQLHPLADYEREMFVGKWLLEKPKDKIAVEISPASHNELKFQTTVLTAPPDAPGRFSDEKASMRGRLLLVEEPPNYRLYKLSDDGRTLNLIGNDLFTFKRT